MAAAAAAIVGASVAVIGLGLSAYQMASQPSMPDAPNLGLGSRAGIEADAATLADRLRMEAAARQGGTATYTAPPTQLAGQIANLQRKIQTQREQGRDVSKLEARLATLRERASAHQRTADFTGFGEADVQGAIARQMAQNLLDLQEKYGPQFIEEALKQQELADPEGAAARRKMYELIMQQAEAEPDRPVARLLDEQVGEQLAAGRNLDRVSDEVLREAVAQSRGARGESLDDTRFDDPLTGGFAGEARLQAAQQKAMGWLTSGATPEDVAYRRDQQTLGNLGSFIEGTSPQSQFQNLSGAQQGPAPVVTGPPNARPNANAGAAANQTQIAGWNSQLGAAANQVDPWMAGLSVLLTGASVAGRAGYQPLRTGP
jgi:hypothetical protein